MTAKPPPGRANALLGKEIDKAVTGLSGRPFRLAAYTVAGLPDATRSTGALIYVSDESGGAVPAFSDGSDWRRVTDRAVVS